VDVSALGLGMQGDVFGVKFHKITVSGHSRRSPSSHQLRVPYYFTHFEPSSGTGGVARRYPF
jgi:hypothetical protein